MNEIINPQYLQLIKEVGAPLFIIVFMGTLFSWVLRRVILHFINTIHEQNEERKEAHATFLTTIKSFSNSIQENTHGLDEVNDVVIRVEGNSKQIIQILNQEQA